MKLNQLFYFCRACAHQNITKAAEELHVSQPSISASIRELEEEFGVQLMQRNNKGFTLTEEGKYFYERAATLLASADDLEQMMRDMGNQRKRINLGIPPMIGTFLFPMMYAGFKQKFPDIFLHSREGGTRELLNLLDNSALDFIIVPINHLSARSYNMLPLMEIETVFCVAKQHPLAKKRKVSIAQIKDEPLIMFHRGYFQNEIIKERYEAVGCTPNIIHYSSQFYTIREFISKGIAAGFMFKVIADTVPEIKGISLDTPLRIKIGIVWKLNQHMFNDATHFLNYARKYAKKL